MFDPPEYIILHSFKVGLWRLLSMRKERERENKGGEDSKSGFRKERNIERVEFSNIKKKWI